MGTSRGIIAAIAIGLVALQSITYLVKDAIFTGCKYTLP